MFWFWFFATFVACLFAPEGKNPGRVSERLFGSLAASAIIAVVLVTATALLG